MKTGTPSHPKFKKLQRRTKLSTYGTVGLLEMLWLLAAQFADDGDLTRFSDEEISDFLEWDRPEIDIVEALIECRWIDREEGQTTIHGWDEHCPSYIYDRRRKREERARKCGRKADESRTVENSPGKSRTVTRQSPPTGSGLGKPNLGERAQRVRVTLEDLVVYAKTLDPAKYPGADQCCERFIDHYTSNGWRVGRNPMKDWQATFRNWVSRQSEFGSDDSGDASATPMHNIDRASTKQRKAEIAAACEAREAANA